MSNKPVILRTYSVEILNVIGSSTRPSRVQVEIRGLNLIPFPSPTQSGCAPKCVCGEATVKH